MSRTMDNDGSSAEFFCRIPSLPDLDGTFSLEPRRNHHEVAVIPDFNASTEADSALPMLFPKTSPNLPYLGGNSRVESIHNPSESQNFPLSSDGLSHPRDLESHECTSRQLWDATRQREIIAKRPKPMYPRGLSEGKVASRRLCYHETPSRTSSVEGTSSPCEVTPYIHSTGSSPHGFQIQNNLFIPIREEDSDLFVVASKKEQKPLLPRTRLDNYATPPPTLTLRPRGKQPASLALPTCFL
mmetsp:Transcript_8619/g.20728  ORF Transcript_8619/g.20728 Transcript_8619/m.20728 type:complete len:242 (-) Transcript_8619:444-1169(-)